MLWQYKHYCKYLVMIYMYMYQSLLHTKMKLPITGTHGIHHYLKPLVPSLQLCGVVRPTCVLINHMLLKSCSNKITCWSIKAFKGLITTPTAVVLTASGTRKKIFQLLLPFWQAHLCHVALATEKLAGHGKTTQSGSNQSEYF